jgi:quercetin dioxygenase-like cupin family protein
LSVASPTRNVPAGLPRRASGPRHSVFPFLPRQCKPRAVLYLDWLPRYGQYHRVIVFTAASLAKSQLFVTSELFKTKGLRMLKEKTEIVMKPSQEEKKTTAGSPEEARSRCTRRGLLGAALSVAAAGAVSQWLPENLAAGSQSSEARTYHGYNAVAAQKEADLLPVSKNSTTIAGEPLAYLSTPNPEISSYIVPIAPGATTQWMTHPVPAYLYVLEGTLTVEFAEDGSRQTFTAGKAFLQARSHWHRGRNDGTEPVRFLAVFAGAKDVPNVLHPPSGDPARS